MITRSKNNFKKIYVVDKLCEKSDMLECDVVEIKHEKNVMMYRGRVVIAYCACKCGTLQFAKFKGDKEKFDYQLSNGISINPLDFC